MTGQAFIHLGRGVSCTMYHVVANVSKNRGAPEVALFLKFGKVFFFPRKSVPALDKWESAVSAGVVTSMADVAVVGA